MEKPGSWGPGTNMKRLLSNKTGYSANISARFFKDSVNINKFDEL